VLRRALPLVLLLGCDFLQPEPKSTEPTPAKKVEAPAPVVDDTAVWPAGPVREGPVAFVFAVYGLGDGNLEKVAKAEVASHAATLPKLLGDGATGEKGRGVALEFPAMDTFAPPDPETLSFSGEGLTPEQVQAVQGSKNVAVLTFVTEDPADAETLNREALTMIEEIAEKSGGLPWDEVTRQLFSLEAWKTRIEFGPEVPDERWRHFTVHNYRDGALIRAVTLGLGKFGLPELAADEIAANAVAAAMSAGEAVGPGGVLPVRIDEKTMVEVPLGVGTPEEGDAPGRLAVLRFPGTGSLQERQAALLTKAFGAPDDTITETDPNDAELAAASAQAKKDLAALKEHFADGVPDMEMLSVKAPFTTDDQGTEWMWVEVTSWDGDTMTGILQNQPRAVAALKVGAKVEVKVDAVFDYIHREADGTVGGGKTNDILERRYGG